MRMRLLGLAAITWTVLLGGGMAAGAVVPARYRVCASVAWNPPSVAQQRRHLARNARWSPVDRADPLPALQFPFIVRRRSGSISYDQSELGGLWTLSRHARARIARCPFPGGPRRNYVVIVKGWKVTRAELAAGGDVVAYGTPSPGGLEFLSFPGYGTFQGLDNRDFVLERTDIPGCAISSIETPAARFDDLDARGITCDELRSLQVELDAAPDWAGPTDGFACAVGLSGQIACADGAGRTLRFSYSSGL